MPFFHVFIAPRAGVTAVEIETKMNLALDWYRYDPKCWIVYTSTDAAKLNERLKPLVQPGGNVFICLLDTSERAGWMNKDFWEWLRKAR